MRTSIVHRMNKHILAGLVFSLHMAASSQQVNGPLRVNPENPRYFTDNSGKSIYLAGSHTWENLQDIYKPGEKKMSFPAYLEMMHRNGHNFMRMWMFEQPLMASWTADTIFIEPLPFARTGPGVANDGNPKFNLEKYNPAYFSRLRKRVIEAGRKNIYVSVMLFQGWCLDRTKFGVGNPFPFLPYHIDNNINGIDAPETTEDFDDRPSLHSMMISPDLLRVQEEYVKKVISTLNDLDNVLYEVINEGGATGWQYHIINLIKQTEKAMPKQHPVGMTHRGDPKQPNQVLFDSPADWISPNAAPVTWHLGDSAITSSFKFDPPQADGKKVVVPDTDHLWGHGGNYKWVWKSFLRGLNPVYMDPWEPLAGEEDEKKTTGWIFDEGGITKDQRYYPEHELIRKNLGYTREYANKVNLTAMSPHAEISSTGYCLASTGKEYLIYFPESGKARIDLRDAPGEYTVEWFIPVINKIFPGPRTVSGGGMLTMQAPTSLDVLLWLKRKE